MKYTLFENSFSFIILDFKKTSVLIVYELSIYNWFNERVQHLQRTDKKMCILTGTPF